MEKKEIRRQRKKKLLEKKKKRKSKKLGVERLMEVVVELPQHSLENSDIQGQRKREALKIALRQSNFIFKFNI